MMMMMMMMMIIIIIMVIMMIMTIRINASRPISELLVLKDRNKTVIYNDQGSKIKEALWRPLSFVCLAQLFLTPDGILFHWFCKCTPPWMFLPLDIPSEYRPEHVTFGLLCVIFKFPSRIFCRRVPGFATDCPCGVWCRGLTTCLLYVGPPLEF